MLTLTKLGEMTPEQRTAEFDRLISELWPDSTNRAETISEKLGVTKPTFFGWRRENRVPDIAILLLQEWATTYDNSAEVRLWAGVADRLAQITATMQDVTDQIGSLASHLGEVAGHRAASQARNAAGGKAEHHEFPKSSEV